MGELVTYMQHVHHFCYVALETKCDKRDISGLVNGVKINCIAIQDLPFKRNANVDQLAEITD